MEPSTKSKRTSRRRSKSNRASGKLSPIIELNTGDQNEISQLEKLIAKGPVTVVLVFSTTCPHCISYMPIWDKLCKVSGRKANMVKVLSSAYQNIPLSQKKPVESVPTVLYVDSEGKVTEATKPRDTEIMSNAVKLQPGSDLPPNIVKQSEQSQVFSSDDLVVNDEDLNDFERAGDPLTDADVDIDVAVPDVAVPDDFGLNLNNSILLDNAAVPGTRVSADLLHPLPATVVVSRDSQESRAKSKSKSKTVEPMQFGGSQDHLQSGGNPWAAFVLATAQQAAPAAALFGAYSLMPSRSSGLGAPRKSRKTRRRRSKKSKGL